MHTVNDKCLAHFSDVFGNDLELWYSDDKVPVEMYYILRIINRSDNTFSEFYIDEAVLPVVLDAFKKRV